MNNGMPMGQPSAYGRVGKFMFFFSRWLWCYKKRLAWVNQEGSPLTCTLIIGIDTLLLLVLIPYYYWYCTENIHIFILQRGSRTRGL